MAKISDNTVLYNRAPASFLGNRWLDASVTGSGKVCAAMLGAYARESILINHTDLKWRGYTGVLQDVSDVFPRIRKHYSDAKIMDAERTLSSEFEKRGYKPVPDQTLPLAVLNLNFANDTLIYDYERTTDMASGEVAVEYKTGVNTGVKRGLFVARGSDIVAYNASKTGQDKFNVVIGLSHPEGVQTQNSTIKYEGGFIYFANRSANGLDYGLVARVITSSGEVAHQQNGIAIRGSDGFTVFAKTFVNSSMDTEFKNLKNELSAIKHNYDKLQSQSENAHKKFFEEASLQLDSDSREYELSWLVGSQGIDTKLIERLFNFGKYLSIIGYDRLMNMNTSVTANLLYDGIVKSVAPNNILELFESYEKYIDDLKKNAARIFGCRGYFIPRVVSPQSALLGSTDSGVIHFIASGAIMANLFYSHFLATADAKTLKSRMFPFMKEVFNFYSDFLKLDNNGVYSTIPSYSPDSTPGNTIQGKPLADFKFTTNSTIDFLSISALLDNLCEAAEAVGMIDDIPMWQDMKTKMPKYSVNDTGAIKEYTNSAFIDGINNCGCMHTYGLWPLKNFSFASDTIQYRAAVSGALPSNVTLKKASANAISNRLNKAAGLQTASVLAMYALQLAHAGEVSAVRNVLLRLVASSFTASGLCLSNDWRGSGWTREGTVELDVSGNIGFASSITECIVQSKSNALKILPCIFPEIQSGKIEGVITDFAARVNIDWDMRRGRASLKILPKNSCKIDIVIPENFKKPKSVTNFDNETNTIKGVQLTAGKTFSLDFN